ncbi:hypothetical protein BH20ACT1_BH20ACT1_07900 [soil metagenome]
MEGPFDATTRGWASPVALGPHEVGQHLVVAPAVVAKRCPVVEVTPVASEVDLGVDGRRAPERLAPGPIEHAPVQPDLRLGAVAPVVGRVEEPGEGERDSHGQLVVGVPGLQEEHLSRRVLAEAVGQDAASRACAHHHVVGHASGSRAASSRSPANGEHHPPRPPPGARARPAADPTCPAVASPQRPATASVLHGHHPADQPVGGDRRVPAQEGIALEEEGASSLASAAVDQHDVVIFAEGPDLPPSRMVGHGDQHARPR